ADSSILYFDVHVLILLDGHTHSNGTHTRKLYRVTDDVRENLPKALTVGTNPDRLTSRFNDERKRFLLGDPTQWCNRGFNFLAKIEFFRLQLKPAGLDFGKIENIIDKIEQAFTRNIDRT